MTLDKYLSQLNPKELGDIIAGLQQIQKEKEEAERLEREQTQLTEYTGKVAGYVLKGYTTERYSVDDISGICIPGLERVLDELPEDLKVEVTIKIMGHVSEGVEDEWSGQDFAELVYESDEGEDDSEERDDLWDDDDEDAMPDGADVGDTSEMTQFDLNQKAWEAYNPKARLEFVTTFPNREEQERLRNAQERKQESLDEPDVTPF